MAKALKKKVVAKKATPKKIVKKAISKKTASKKSVVKKTIKKDTTAKAAKKSITQKQATKKSAPKKTAVKKTAPKKSIATHNKPLDTPRLSPYDATQQVNEVVHSQQKIPADGSDNATEQREHLDFIPDQFKTSPHDPYHGHTEPGKAKGAQKPTGKKPLWNTSKKHK